MKLGTTRTPSSSKTPHRGVPLDGGTNCIRVAVAPLLQGIFHPQPLLCHPSTLNVANIDLQLLQRLISQYKAVRAPTAESSFTLNMKTDFISETLSFFYFRARLNVVMKAEVCQLEHFMCICCCLCEEQTSCFDAILMNGVFFTHVRTLGLTLNNNTQGVYLTKPACT